MDVEKDVQDVAEHFFFFLKICLQRVRRNDFKFDKNFDFDYRR